MTHNNRSGTAACLFLTLSAALALGGCDWAKPKVPGAEQRSAKEKLATQRRLKQACGSAQTYDRLKALTFDEASKVQSGASGTLDSLAANTTLRMQDPIPKSRDEQLDITVCEGHLVLDLPPGVQDAFDGDRQLQADVEYSAQAAADGSGLVYQMKGAEPIIYRLAALTLPKGAQLAALALQKAAPPAASPAAPVAAVPDAAPAAAPPPPRVAVAAAPARPVPAVRPAPAPPPPAREVVMRRPAPPPAPRAAAPPPAPAYAGGSARPSFSCGRVTSRVLRMVCADPALATRDRRMSSAFYAALADGDEDQRAALRASRDRFLSFRNRCGTAACLAQSYDDRMAEIGDIARGQ